jgi:hypothetical protein
MLSVADPIKKGLTDVANTINSGDFTKAVGKLTNIMLGDPAGMYSDKKESPVTKAVNSTTKKMLGWGLGPNDPDPPSIRNAGYRRVHDFTHEMEKKKKREILHDEETGEFIPDKNGRMQLGKPLSSIDRLTEEITRLVGEVRVLSSHA